MSFVARAANRARDILYNPAFDRFWIRGMRGVITCLLYHRVDDPDRHAFLTRGGSPVIRPEELSADLGFLRSLDARFLTFADLRKGRFVSDDEIGIIICFDDCFRDNYTNGLDVLERFGIKAVFFQSSAFVDATDMIWEHLLYWHTRDPGAAAWFVAKSAQLFSDAPPAGVADVAVRLREEVPFDRVESLLAGLGSDDEARSVAASIYPDSDDVRRASSRGHEIGSHGHLHLKRSNIDAERFERELATSRTILERIVGERPAAFSYPFNNYQSGDSPIARRYFDQVATVDRARITRDTDPMWIPRFTWPGTAKNALRRRRWLLTGVI